MPHEQGDRMTSDNRINSAAATDTGLDNVLGEWLDPFAVETAVTAADDVEDRGFEFSEWCVIPVALLFVIGDMVLTFLHH